MRKITQILLVEDNELDVWRMEEALREAEAAAKLIIMNSGEEAIQFLRKEAPFEKAVTPDLFFLDLYLPEKSGLEVLKEIKADPALSTIPVIVLTTSAKERDIDYSYHKNANAYLNKPVTTREIADIIKYEYLFRQSSTRE